MPSNSCAVRGCKGKGGHKFPKDETKRKLWCVAISQPNLVPTKWSTICRKHFSADDYEEKIGGGLYGPLIKILKNSAVPVVNLGNEEAEPFFPVDHENNLDKTCDGKSLEENGVPETIPLFTAGLHAPFSENILPAFRDKNAMRSHPPDHADILEETFDCVEGPSVPETVPFVSTGPHKTSSNYILPDFRLHEAVHSPPPNHSNVLEGTFDAVEEHFIPESVSLFSSENPSPCPDIVINNHGEKVSVCAPCPARGFSGANSTLPCPKVNLSGGFRIECVADEINTGAECEVVVEISEVVDNSAMKAASTIDNSSIPPNQKTWILASKNEACQKRMKEVGI